MSTFSNNAINYVIVGGGPVGLLTGLLLHLNGKNVVIFEKRKVYSRNQYVFININSSIINLLQTKKCKNIKIRIKSQTIL